MPVKIRLSRKGKKHQAMYHIVVADSRAPRDGKFIEKLGIYNPMTHPATIELNFEKALAWVQKGAQPTETARSILSVKGVMLKKHLQEGVKKGAITQEEADKRFNAWIEKKEAEFKAEREKYSKKATEEQKKRLAAEAKVNEARKEALLKKQSELAAEAAKAAAENSPETETTPAENKE